MAFALLFELEEIGSGWRAACYNWGNERNGSGECENIPRAGASTSFQEIDTTMDVTTNEEANQEPFCLIPLSGKRGQGLFAKVSSDWFEYLNQFKWGLVTKRGYVARTVGPKGSRTMIYMHREIKGFPEGRDVDHEDGDHLNNTNCNLRIATRSQNNANQHKIREGKSSKYRGVCSDWRSGKWVAQIMFENRHIRVGLYESEEDAARARDGAALALHGEFAHLSAPHLEPIPYVPPKQQVRTSRFKGVGWCKAKRKWRAYRTEGKRMIHLGYFPTEEQAYEATGNSSEAVCV